MKTYLLTAAGVIFLSVVVSLLIPEGKLLKSMTFIMRLICIFVLVQPVTEVFGVSRSSDDIALADYAYVSSVYSSHQSVQLADALYGQFGVSCECDVKVEYTDGNFAVTSVTVYLAANSDSLIAQIYEYLENLGYINITVYAEST